MKEGTRAPSQAIKVSGMHPRGTYNNRMLGLSAKVPRGPELCIRIHGVSSFLMIAARNIIQTRGGHRLSGKL